MNSFSRVLRLTLRYRGTLLGVVVTSLIVGVLWGANIGVVYPFVEVVFKGQSLQEWIDKEIAAAEQRTVELLHSKPRTTQLRRKHQLTRRLEQRRA